MGLRITRNSDRDGKATAKKGKKLSSSGVLAKMPVLWEFLTVEAWEDGEARRTGTVLIFIEEGSVKLCLNDRDQDQVAFVTGSSLEEAFEAADAGLDGDSLDWRQSRRAGGKRG